MSQRIPGYSQPEMIALWKEFVQKTFQRTGFRTAFNGVTRTVNRDGVSRLLVLDEYHGDLEVLEFQAKPGEGKHIGSQEIDVVFVPSNKGRPMIREVRLGLLHLGGQHKFTLTGSL
jgi:hypothetical protein